MKKISEIKEDMYWFYKIKIKDKYVSLRCWCRHHFKKRFLKVLKTCLIGYPWDYGYLYDLEKAKIDEMIEYHKKSKILCVESREQIIRTLSWASKMLYIVQNETDYFSYDGSLKFEELDEKSKNGKTLYQINSDELVYSCNVYVNTKNYARFTRISKEMIDLHPHELYIEKARKLYHKIRMQYEQHWWD